MNTYGMNFCKQISLPTPFMVGDIHVYLLKGDLLTLIDVGPKTLEAREALEFQLKELGYGLSDIEQIVLTHHHVDHAGLADAFSDSIRFVGHADNQRWLNPTKEFLQEAAGFFISEARRAGVPVSLENIHEVLLSDKQYGCQRSLTETIVEGDTIPGHSDLKAIETFGHAQGHLSFYSEQYKSLFGGDVLMSQTKPNPLLEPPQALNGVRAQAMVQHVQSLSKLAVMDIEAVYPGHEAIIESVPTLLADRLHLIENRSEKVLQLMGDRARTAYEICQLLFPKRYEMLLTLTLFETIGQLDLLLFKGKISFETRNGVAFYKKITNND